MKLLSKMAALILALALCASLCPAGLSEKTASYAQTLFDQSKPIEIDIQMDDEAWNNMIATASTEEYTACSLAVNGVLYENVAIRPKGNSSLSSVASRGSERFSWRVSFSKFEKKRTCDGLDILILNNGFKDPGELREALAYDMYAFWARTPACTITPWCTITANTSAPTLPWKAWINLSSSAYTARITESCTSRI